ncbi:MAG: hypothetical protein WCO71_05090, partial [Pseudomonadota bacterium]
FPYLYFSGLARERLGLHADWSVTARWFHPHVPLFFPTCNPPTQKPKKCPDIPTLPTYRSPPSQDFWASFPFHPLPSLPTSPIDHQALEDIVQECSHLLTPAQLRRAESVILDLRQGSDIPLLFPVPGIKVPNANSVALHGEEFTDTLGWWIRSHYVAGPFNAAPFPEFRCNAMLAVQQKDKIRIIMDLSAPDGFSLNDAVDELRLEKVLMSTARKFGYALMDCGRGARIWKWDLVDAYKNIPAALPCLRLQGFKWLGKFFVETQKAFGDKSAVAAFDRLDHTLADLAAAVTDTPPDFVHRILDDLPLVTPSSSLLGPSFATAYANLCRRVGVRLAPVCEKFEKAFLDSTFGTVMGITFDSQSLSWYISHNKASIILASIHGPLYGESVTLLSMQKLMGRLNDVGQMCPVLRGFRHNLQDFLTGFGTDEFRSCSLPPAARTELRVWAAAVSDMTAGMPIPIRVSNPSLHALVFVSDAAGAQFIRNGDLFTPYCTDEYRGAASINALEFSPLWFCATVTWPKFFLLQARDTANHAYGCKSSTLEAIGVLLPFLCCPSALAAKDVLLLTDNEAIVFGWESRHVSHDISASIFLRALHLISCFLGASVSLRHLPRMSTASAVLADNLTRSSTTGPAQRRMIQHAPSPRLPPPLLSWLECPTEDWSLAFDLLAYVQSIMPASFSK